MRIVFFGMPGRLAAAALLALLATPATVVAVAVPAVPGAPPVSPAPVSAPPAGLMALDAGIGLVGAAPAMPPGLAALAAKRGLPVLALRSMGSAAVREALAALAPDLVCVACWPWRIMPALLAVPRLGFLNLHPSPLPELRGPDPLFWAFQQGRHESAVTLHWMDAEFDTGPIAAQSPFELPEGVGWAAAEELAATAGAALLGDLIPRLVAGELPRTPQPPGGHGQPAPRAEDFLIDAAWPAERAFRFMRGTAALSVPYQLREGAPTLRLGAAIGYTPGGRLGAPLLLEGGTARIQMTPGVLTAQSLPWALKGRS
jgi:methionyl-tRNA formyltransferase